MKKFLAGVFTALLIVFMTLAAVFGLVETTLRLATIPSPLARAFALGTELVLGILFLLGTVYLATRVAVRIYGGTRSPDTSTLPGS